MLNLNKRRIDYGKGDVGLGVIGNTTTSKSEQQKTEQMNDVSYKEWPSFLQ